MLVTGASGFIGRAVVQALLRAGHQVVCASRHPRPGTRTAQRASPRGRLRAGAGADWWARSFAGIDAVVNAVGILREQDGQTFRALHAQAPIALFGPASVPGVPLVVQISALGADDRRAEPLSPHQEGGRRCVARHCRCVGHRAAVAGVRRRAVPVRHVQRMAMLPLLVLPRAAPCRCSRCTSTTWWPGCSRCWSAAAGAGHHRVRRSPADDVAGVPGAIAAVLGL